MATRYNAYTEQFEDVDEAEQPTAYGQMMRPDLGAVEDVELKTSELPWWAATAEERAANERRSAPVATGPGTTTAAARSDDPFAMGLAGVMVGRPALDQERLAAQRARDDAADAAQQGGAQAAQQDPGAPANPAPVLPQGPGQIKQSQTVAVTKYKTLSKADQAKQDALDQEREANVGEQLQNAEDAKNYNVDVARQKYANQQTQIGEKEKLAQQLQQIQDDHNSRVRQAEGQLDAEILEQKRLAAEANKDFWGSRTTAERLRGAVYILAGGLAQGMQSIGGGVKGAENVGLNIINKEVEDSIARAKQAVTDQKEMVGYAKERVGRAKDAKKEALADYALMRAARLDIVGDQLEAEILKRGGDAAAIEGNRALQTIRKSAIDERQKALDNKLREVTSTTRSQVLQVTGSLAGGAAAGPIDASGFADKPNNKWTATERASDAYASRMTKAVQTIDATSFSKEDLEVLRGAQQRERLLGPRGAEFAKGILGDVYQRLSPEGQKKFLGIKDFILADLRKESGAAISVGEIADWNQTYGVDPADSDEARGQKTSMRLEKIWSAAAQSGRPATWGARLNSTFGSQVQPQPAPAPARGAAPAPGPAPTMTAPGKGTVPAPAYQDIVQRNPKTGATRVVRRYADGRQEVVSQ